MIVVLTITIFLLSATSSVAEVVGYASDNFSVRGGVGYCGGKTESESFKSASSGGNMEIKALSSPSFRASPGIEGSILAQAGSTVTSIDPSSGYNTSPIHINKISGTRFAANPTVKLTADGETDMVATNVTVTVSSEISCDLNIAGARVGLWTVVVENTTGESASLINGFEVKSYSFDSSVAINSPNPFDPGTESTTMVYKLSRDANVVLTIFNTTGELLWKRTYAAGTKGGQTGDNSVAWDGITDFSEMVSNGVYPFHVIDRDSGKTLSRGKIAVIRQ